MIGNKIGGNIFKININIFNPDHYKRIAALLWFVFFCYAICAALIFQKLLLPLFPSLHAGRGLLIGDAVYFNTMALDIAERIALNGWSSWHPFEVSGNIAINSAVYAIFGHDIVWMVPFNAAVHALGGMLIFLLAYELVGNKRIAIYAGIVASCLFVFFPSALNWYSQSLKDGYAIVGIFLILLTWLKAARGVTHLNDWILLVLVHAAGILVTASVRPYNLELLLLAAAGAWVIIVIAAMLQHQMKQQIALLVFFMISTVILLVGIRTVAAGIKNAEFRTMKGATVLSQDFYYANWTSKSWQWQNTSWFPDSLEHYAELSARTRAGLIDYGLKIKAMSMIDSNIQPRKLSEVASYLPRGLQIGMFAPFPSSWFSSISVTRMVATVEIVIYYLCVPGILLLLWHHRSTAVFLSLYFSIFFLLVQGFTISNLGTLYRIRYGFLFILILMGVSGWFVWLERSGRFKRG